MFVKFEDNLRLIVIGCLHIISLVDFISETSNYKTEKSQQVPTKLVATENTRLTRPQNSSEPQNTLNERLLWFHTPSCT